MAGNLSQTVTTSGRRLVLLVVPPVRELDLVAIVDVFASANRLLSEEQRYQIEIATTAREKSIEGMQGLQFVGGRHFSEIKSPIDTLLIPGGEGIETTDPGPDVVSWLTQSATRCRRVGSICTGAFLLAQAGLLNGRRATTHWAFAKELAARFPAVKVDPEPIWIRDGHFYSSAGVTSGIDLSLALLEEDHGRRIALEVARTLVVFLCRPGNQAQFSVSLQEQTTEHRPLRDLQIWILENLNKDLSIPNLASHVAMSERNFQRVFRREVGKSAGRYVDEVRIEAVRRKLERSTHSLDEIAAACGFGSADVMGRSFQRHLHTTPAEYRARFRSSGIKRLPPNKLVRI
jgi:transcriptional regulator GlxA family with amidase domain